MQGGLISEGDFGDGPHIMGTAEESASMTEAPAAGESHLDSFFRNSGWTREDLQLVLLTINTLLVLAAALEVSR